MIDVSKFKGIKENISNIARIITITLKLTKKMEDTTFSKLSI